MSKHKTKLLVGVILIFGMAAVLVPFVMWSAPASSSTRMGGDFPLMTPANTVPITPLLAVNILPTPAPELLTVVPAVTPVPPSAPPASDTALLNARHRFALGMIETANNDEEIGGAGEVSRYQIMPSVWKHYSDSQNYQNPHVSLEVAQQHWSVLYASFIKQAHREPTDFDMYVLWNTRYGYYASKRFNPALLHPVVRDRAQRFVNLVGRGES
jgi:hypothetical protein